MTFTAKAIEAYCDIFQMHPSECREFRAFLDSHGELAEVDIDEMEENELVSAGEADAMRWALA